MQKQILVVGSINKDLVLRVDDFPLEGQTILAKSFESSNGGKGANQASAIAKLGGNVSLLGALGNDVFGTELLESLKSSGVDTTHILIKENISSGIAVITLDKNGANHIMVSAGANALLTNDDVTEDFLNQFDIVIIQLEIPLHFAKHVAMLARKLDKTVILNPSPAVRLDEDFLGCVNILVPNETEIEIVGGIDYVLGCGVEHIVLTLGSNGCELISKDTREHFDAHKVKVVDTTAAGDSFLGALAIRISYGERMQRAIDFANRVAAMSVTRKGAISSIPSYDEILRFGLL